MAGGQEGGDKQKPWIVSDTAIKRNGAAPPHRRGAEGRRRRQQQQQQQQQPQQQQQHTHTQSSDGEGSGQQQNTHGIKMRWRIPARDEDACRLSIALRHCCVETRRSIFGWSQVEKRNIENGMRTVSKKLSKKKNRPSRSE
jgi:hypothetical protein